MGALPPCGFEISSGLRRSTNKFLCRFLCTRKRQLWLSGERLPSWSRPSFTVGQNETSQYEEELCPKAAELEIPHWHDNVVSPSGRICAIFVDLTSNSKLRDTG